MPEVQAAERYLKAYNLNRILGSIDSPMTNEGGVCVLALESHASSTQVFVV